MILIRNITTFSKPTNRTNDITDKIGAVVESRADYSTNCTCVCHWTKSPFCEVCRLKHHFDFKQTDLFGDTLPYHCKKCGHASATMRESSQHYARKHRKKNTQTKYFKFTVNRTLENYKLVTIETNATPLETYELHLSILQKMQSEARTQ